MTLARLRELEAAATPGPWKATDEAEHGLVLNFPDTDENLALTLAARNLLPALLDVAEPALEWRAHRAARDACDDCRNNRWCKIAENAWARFYFALTALVAEDEKL